MYPKPTPATFLLGESSESRGHLADFLIHRDISAGSQRRHRAPHSRSPGNRRPASFRWEQPIGSLGVSCVVFKVCKAVRTHHMLLPKPLFGSDQVWQTKGNALTLGGKPTELCNSSSRINPEGNHAKPPLWSWWKGVQSKILSHLKYGHDNWTVSLISFLLLSLIWTESLMMKTSLFKVTPIHVCRKRAFLWCVCWK